MPGARRQPKKRNWGGARPGAGRPPNGETAGVSHLRRPRLSGAESVRIILRVQAGLPSLRTASVAESIRAAVEQGRERFGFRLVRYSVRDAELHLVVHASHRRALSRGIQGLSIRIARAVNRCLKRQGRLFADRYEASDARPDSS
jgi:putative transposase